MSWHRKRLFDRYRGLHDGCLKCVCCGEIWETPRLRNEHEYFQWVQISKSNPVTRDQVKYLRLKKLFAGVLVRASGG